MKLVLVSDTHFWHDALDIPDGDVLLHAGDLTRHGTLADVEVFNDYLGTLPHAHKIVVAGNHDFCFEREPQAARPLLTNAIYLEDEAVTIDGVHFYGSPWQPWFYDWAFNLERGEPLRRKWDLIPDHTDVLVTHSPPQGHGDRTQSGTLAGCEELIVAVERVQPALHVFGHIHEAYGTTRNALTSFVNASICDLSYNPLNAPVCWEL
jgi:Icc-related predicted phosphoesterase